MGSAGSKLPITPTRPLCNKHLSHVTDPRSPTTGILRTPIEIEKSSRVTPQPTEEDAQEVAEGPRSADPRSPTHGIHRTPLKPTVTEALQGLVKQLSEAFTLEENPVMLGAEKQPAELLQGMEKEAQQSTELLQGMKDVQQVAELLQSTEAMEQQAELLQRTEDEQQVTDLQGNKEALQAAKLLQAMKQTAQFLQGSGESRTVQTLASAEEVELALGLLQLADVGLPGEDTRSQASPEEVELALGLLQLADVGLLPEETGLEASPEVALCAEVTQQSIGEDPSIVAEGNSEPLGITEAQLQEKGSRNLHGEAAAPEVRSVETVPRASCLPSSPTSRPSGVKSVRQRPRKLAGKVLAASAGNGRSPLKILRDDNSPSPISHRQVKKHPTMSDGVNERMESTSRPLRLSRGWEDIHNKENARYPRVEN